MINCPGKCLNTSTFRRADLVETCGSCCFQHFRFYCDSWIVDSYNCSCDINDCNISGNCYHGKCEMCHQNSEGDCPKAASDYKAEIEEYVARMRNHVDKVMHWLNNRLHLMEDQLQKWCNSTTTSTTSTTSTTTSTTSTTAISDSTAINMTRRSSATRNQFYKGRSEILQPLSPQFIIFCLSYFCPKITYCPKANPYETGCAHQNAVFSRNSPD